MLRSAGVSFKEAPYSKQKKEKEKEKESFTSER